MALTEPQVKVLAALAILDPAQVLTVRELYRYAGRKESAVRTAIQRLADAGFAQASRSALVGWRITARGRALLQAPSYREYALRNGGQKTNGAHG
ncbi:hypothetical protein AB0E01_00630 [Nocardia vinacea]|uniref:hypothetical protein n=1 Tax=Nocardia vinacea TaxID=96468 RepID=UPI0033C917DC